MWLPSICAAASRVAPVDGIDLIDDVLFISGKYFSVLPRCNMTSFAREQFASMNSRFLFGEKSDSLGDDVPPFDECFD